MLRLLLIMLLILIVMMPDGTTILIQESRSSVVSNTSTSKQEPTKTKRKRRAKTETKGKASVVDQESVPSDSVIARIIEGYSANAFSGPEAIDPTNRSYYDEDDDVIDTRGIFQQQFGGYSFSNSNIDINSEHRDDDGDDGDVTMEELSFQEQVL
jgi:hypothetical protein